MKQTLTLLLLFFSIETMLNAQNNTGDLALNAEINSVLDEGVAVNIAERLSLLADDPVKINSGDEEEIARLYFLTEFQVKVLADYVVRKGNIVSVYEIALLPGFDKATAMMMEPYISLDVPKSYSLKKRGVTTAVATVMYKKTLSENDTAGMRSLLRLCHEGGDISMCLTAENDPGEKFNLSHQPGFDFLSGWISFQGKSLVNRVIAGDYSLRFGEGLVFNNNSWQGGWLSSPSFMAGREAVAPYSSTDENNFFRGAAVILGKITSGAVVFVSSNKIDGRIKYTDADSSAYISNLVAGGIHASISGKEARNALTENIAGIHLTTGTRLVRAGLTVAGTLFSLPFHPDTTEGADIYKFEGDRLLNIGLDLKASFGKVVIYGEAGWSHPGAFASIAGLRAVPSERVTLNIMARHLSPKYHSFHSGVFGSASASSNEYGVAGNIQLEAARHLFLTGGADIFYHPWLSYRSSGPSTGFRTDMRAEYNPFESLACRLTFNILRREYDAGNDTGIPQTEDVKRYQVSLLSSWAYMKSLSFTSRVIYCRTSESNETGYLLCQDVCWSPSALPLRTWLRYSLFTTDGWNARLYAYENDMLQTSSIPALYGEGSRIYLMTEWKVTPKLLLRIKYAATFKEEDQEHTSLHELRLQIKIMI